MKKKKKKWPLISITCTTIFLITFIIFIIKVVDLLSIEPAYKIDSRVDKIEEYKNENKDKIINGWLRVQGTNIDYPVLYDEDMYKLEQQIGDFVWVLENPEKELIDRTVILGHNIRNVSSDPLIADQNHTRFEQLMSFIYYNFARENQYIQYTKDGEDYLYKIFSVTLIDDRDIKYTGYLETEDFKEYIEKAIEDSYFDYNIEVNENDKIITLVTCTRFFGNKTQKFKVEGKLLVDEEKIELTEVKEKSNYKEIKNTMKGGESYEKSA